MHLTARSSGPRCALLSWAYNSFLSSQTSPKPPCPIFFCLVHFSCLGDPRCVRRSLWVVRPCWKVASSRRCRTSSGSSWMSVICNRWLVRPGDYTIHEMKANSSSCFVG